MRRTGRCTELIEGRDVPISKTNLVNRTLPHRDRRMVGAWCFVDTYGPDAVITMPGMRVPPHPHVGLQTVSWLLDGAVDHRDSLGTHQLVQPGPAEPDDGRARHLALGGVAGRAAALAARRPAVDRAAGCRAATSSRGSSTSPSCRWSQLGGVAATVLVGALGGATSPATVYSPLVGADLDVDAVRASCRSTRRSSTPSSCCAARSRSTARASSRAGCSTWAAGGPDRAVLGWTAAGCLLLGGEPFEEQIVMWWNFVARIARGDRRGPRAPGWAGWTAASVFGRVAGLRRRRRCRRPSCRDAAAAARPARR